MSGVSEQLAAISIRAPVRTQLGDHLRHPAGLVSAPHASVDNRQIGKTVLIKIREDGPEPRAAPRGVGQSRHGRAFLKQAARPLLPERVVLLGQMRDENIEQAVAIHVTGGDAHVRVRAAHGVVGEAAPPGLVAKSAVVLIDPERVRLRVIGHQNVRPAISVEVSADHAEAGTGQIAES